MKNLIKLYICIATLLMTACVKDDIASTGSIIGIIKDNSTYETLQGPVVHDLFCHD